MPLDKSIRCLGCKQMFEFGEEEQAFFRQMGFTNLPKRCVNCRLTARYKRAGKDTSALHDATCTVCNAPTVVPFEPSADRPVYCQVCLINERSKDSVSVIS